MYKANINFILQKTPGYLSIIDTLNVVIEFEKAAYVVVFHQQSTNTESTQ